MILQQIHVDRNHHHPHPHPHLHHDEHMDPQCEYWQRIDASSWNSVLELVTTCIRATEQSANENYFLAQWKTTVMKRFRESRAATDTTTRMGTETDAEMGMGMGTGMEMVMGTGMRTGTRTRMEMVHHQRYDESHLQMSTCASAWGCCFCLCTSWLPESVWSRCLDNGHEATVTECVPLCVCVVWLHHSCG